MKGKESSSSSSTTSSSSKSCRPNLKAGNIINTSGMSVNRSRRKSPGQVPGVEIGDIFYFRMEIACIGMHGPLQAGIDYISPSSSSSSSSLSSSSSSSYMNSSSTKGPDDCHHDHRSQVIHYDTPIAVSIISSGVYDSRDDGEVLVYTGQGGRGSGSGSGSGNKNKNKKKPHEDQKLERGNLALEGSMKRALPIRVIRGVKDPTSPTGKVYTYDGLYRVVGCWTETGKSGFEEYKFRLCRLPRQPELGSARLHLSQRLKLACGEPGRREGLRVADISLGKESEPVCVVNTSDDVALRPREFQYITANLHEGDPHESSDKNNCSSSSSSSKDRRYYYYYNYDGSYPQGCDCVGACSPTRACACFLRNGCVFPYLRNGALVKEKGSIHECGAHCKCSSNCRNRATQRGRGSKPRLEVFKTEDRGWGLRSWDTIPAGSFVGEYTGRIVDNKDVSMSSSEKQDYILDVFALPDREPPWGHIPETLANLVLGWQETTKYMLVRPHIVIDSSKCGNALRFVNHSGCPNLLVQCVFRDHNSRFPHVMLFAMDNIPPFQELTLDYGWEQPSVIN